MPKYLALFRGINVAGRKIIRMEALRHHMEGAGFSNVTTYIQSGNVVFTSDEHSKKALTGRIEDLVKNHYNFDVTVFVRDLNDIENAVDNNPFVSQREPEGAGSKKLYVTFLSWVPAPEDMERLRQAPIGHDMIEIVDDMLYFKLNTMASESKLSNNLIESKLKLKATTRNWNTTLKLFEMMRQ